MLMSNPPNQQSSDAAAMEFHAKVPATSLDDLKGMDQLQTKLKKNVILPFAYASKAALLRLNIPRAIFLYGAPGTGKTALADAIVTEIGKTREVKYYREAGACISIGEPSENLHQLFKTAKENAPSVIFLDQMDGLGKSSGMQSTLTALLHEIHNLVPGDVLLIAATSRHEAVHGNLVGKGRFDMMFTPLMPNSIGREQILQHYFGKKGISPSAEVITEVVQRTERCAGGELKSLVERIYTNAVHRICPDGSWKDLTEQEIQDKLRAVKELDMDLDVRPVLPELQVVDRSMFRMGNIDPVLRMVNEGLELPEKAKENCTII